MSVNEWRSTLGIPADPHPYDDIGHGIGTVVFYIVFAVCCVALAWGIAHGV